MKRIMTVFLLAALCGSFAACNTTPYETVPVQTIPAEQTTADRQTDPSTTTKEDEPLPEDDDKTIEISIFWEPPKDFTTPEHYDLLKNAGITHIEITNRDSWSSLRNVEKIIELCAERGMTVTYHSAKTDTFIGMTEEQIADTIKNYKDNPTVSGYFIVDEPASPINYANAYKALIKADPDCRPALNLLPHFATWVFENYNGYIEDFIVSVGKDTIKEISYDQYPFPDSKGSKPTNMYYNLDIFRKVGLKYNVDTAFYIQSIGETGNFRRTNEAEVRFHVASGLAYGIKHYKYFTWWTTGFCDEKYYAIISPYGEVTDLYDGVKNVNSEVSACGKILAHLDALEVYHTKSGYDATELLPSSSAIKPVGKDDVIVSFMQHRTTGRDYIMLVNKDFKNAKTIEFSVDGINELYNASTGEYVPVDISSGKVSLDFKAGGFVLLALGEADNIVNPVYDENKTNIAYNKPVYASSVQSSNGYYAYCVTDGIKDASHTNALGWKTNTDGYIEVDFKREVSFNRVDLYPTGTEYLLGAMFAKNFKILYSNDRVNYTQLVSKTDYSATEAIPTFKFDTVKARYLKIEMSAGELAEIEVFNDDGSVPQPDNTRYKDAGGEPSGTNIALNRPVSVSSSLERTDWGWSYKYANDGKLKGDAYGGWTSMTGQHMNDPTAPEWVCIDLCREYAIDRVVLYPRQDSGAAYFPESYEVQVSADGVNFTTVKTVSELRTDNTPSVIDLGGTNGRYVRIYATKMTMPSPNDGYLFQLAELEIYNK